MYVGLDLYSYHFNQSAGYENFTPGFYVVQDAENLCKGFAGVYRNSERDTSVEFGCSFEYNKFSVAIGAITGYKAGRILPFVYPSYAISIEKNTNFRIGYIPRVSGFTNSAVLHFQVERRF